MWQFMSSYEAMTFIINCVVKAIQLGITFIIYHCPALVTHNGDILVFKSIYIYAPQKLLSTTWV